MTHCPCCSHSMIRHIRQQQVHWFCRVCWQEMPVLEQVGVSARLEVLMQHIGVSAGEASGRSPRIA